MHSILKYKMVYKDQNKYIPSVLKYIINSRNRRMYSISS